ncbi:MAG: efflux RND transporter periplasmic adaptor subunit [Chloroflexi bacterium]|nr:efflux RND transporter periplasmic adaptor subunit [Chloroflexota bacterium]
MKNKLTTAIILLIVISTIGFAGCRGKQPEASQKQIAEVMRGDLVVTISADGNLNMPHESQLKFGTPGTVKEVFVVEGQQVKEGALLAKLDDTTQKLAVASAQYNVELAMNELVEKIHPALMGYPKMYPDTSTVLQVEQAQEELRQVQKLLQQGKYQEAAAELRLAIQDLEASYYMLKDTQRNIPLETYDILGQAVETYPEINDAIELLKQDLQRLAEIQGLIEQGKYAEASAALDTTQQKLKETHLLVKSLSGRIRISQRIGACCGQLAMQGLTIEWILNPNFQPIPLMPNPTPPPPLIPDPTYDPNYYLPTEKYIGPGTTGLMPIPYPDTSTSLDWLRQVEENLQKIQACKEDEGCDALELNTLLRMAQHDIEMSQTILENNELIFRSGLNLKALRGYNLNLKLAENELKNAKEALMKTEILAPFDGTVVDIGVKENDQLSSFDYSSKTAVHLVDTRTVKMDGVVDEIDIYKVKVGQEAVIIVDALPDAELKGKVTFISPFGTQTTGVVEFAVTISLDPTETELKGGLTATADIIVEKHENVLLIPNRSIKGSPRDYWVDVIIDEKKVTTEKRQVILGAQNDQFSEIISGISEGEKIIVEATRGRASSSF